MSIAPSLDGIMNYKTYIEDDMIYIDIDLNEMKEYRCNNMVKQDLTKDNRHFVIIGGGASGYMCAQTLRYDGF